VLDDDVSLDPVLEVGVDVELDVEVDVDPTSPVLVEVDVASVVLASSPVSPAASPQDTRKTAGMTRIRAACTAALYHWIPIARSSAQRRVRTEQPVEHRQHAGEVAVAVLRCVAVMERMIIRGGDPALQPSQTPAQVGV